MSELTNNNLSFFSNATINRQPKDSIKNCEDPTPFGLNFQEPFPTDKNAPADSAVTMSQCPTCLPTTTDSNIDIDYNF